MTSVSRRARALRPAWARIASSVSTRQSWWPTCTGPRFAHVFELDPVGVNADGVGGRPHRPRAPAGRARGGRQRRDCGIRDERRLPAQRVGKFVGQALPVFLRRRRERAKRTDGAMPWTVRGRDRLDEEMIDVLSIADSPGRALDEHAAAISLLRPRECQGKSTRKLVTILRESALAARNSKSLRGTPSPKRPLSPGGPWKSG